MSNNSPILSIRNASLSFAKKLLFSDLSINIFARDRVCLIGKNGVGKTTLMNAIIGTFDLDEGERQISPNTSIGYLSQNENIEQNISARKFLQNGLNLDEEKTYLIDIICEKLEIDQNALTQNLSGGQKRRVHLARALILEPDILMLDEPTNHLDLEIIKWLEGYLQSYKGSLLIISHDRNFLKNTTNKVFWLRANKLNINEKGYDDFEEWSQNIIEHENKELANLQKKYTLESGWLQTGVTGRRKRNIGRLHYLNELKEKLAKQRVLVKNSQSSIKITSQKLEEDAPQVIMSFNNVCKSYGDKTLINKFTNKIIRGERIGIIGKNGSGKSTFLKLMVGEIEPDSGNVKMAKDIEFSYFDQVRSQIKPDSSIKDILCESGSDRVQLGNGKEVHVCGYLKNFLFDPKDIDTKAGTLSGGQQNRLLLAKTLAKPGNFMILDEPTNDLDMDSLDILQEYLVNYQGTLIIVSHDRSFLDEVATSILSFEDGEIIHNLGGYSDYIAYKEKYSQETTKDKKSDNKFIEPESNLENQKNNSKSNKKLSYKHKLELEKLPQKIEDLESKILQLTTELNETEDRNPANLAQISIEIAKLNQELDEKESRWLELEEMLLER